MRFGEIALWLFIFIIGSLAVIWIVDGGISSVGHSIKEFFSEKPQVQNSQVTSNQVNIKQTQVPQKSYKEVHLDYWNSCSGIEVNAYSNGMSKNEAKETYCKALCGQYDMDYGYYECRKDKIYCYCEE